MNKKLEQHMLEQNLHPNVMICMLFHVKGLIPPRKTIINTAVRLGWFTFKNSELKPTAKMNAFVFELIELAKAEGEI